MNYPANEIYGTLNVPSKAGTDATITTQLIPPWVGPEGNAPFIYNPSASPSAKRFPPGIMHLTSLCYTNGDTAHVIGIQRPLNYTWLTAAIAAAGTSAVLYDDPGVYSTNYKYSSNLTTGTAQVADNGIAASDWVVIQLVDGTFFVSKVTSVSTLTLTLTTALPSVTGGGAAVGAIVYFFGNMANNDKDPATGFAQLQASVAANATSLNQYKPFSDTVAGFFSTLHSGDPALFYDPGTSHLGTLDYISGFYSRI